MHMLRCGRRWYLSAGFTLIVVLALAGALAACGVQTVNEGSQQNQGTLAGVVVAWPASPVQRVGAPDTTPVPDREVRIETVDGKLVTTVTTDAQGRFSVSLAPGTYVVRVPIVAGKIGMRQSNTPKVQVVAGQTVQVHIQLDTGIR